MYIIDNSLVAGRGGYVSKVLQKGGGHGKPLSVLEDARQEASKGVDHDRQAVQAG